MRAYRTILVLLCFALTMQCKSGKNKVEEPSATQGSTEAPASTNEGLKLTDYETVFFIDHSQDGLQLAGDKYQLPGGYEVDKDDAPTYIAAGAATLASVVAIVALHKVGNVNKALSATKEELGKVSGRLETAEGKLAKAEKELGTVGRKLESSDASVGALNTRLSAVKDEVNTFEESARASLAAAKEEQTRILADFDTRVAAKTREIDELIKGSELGPLKAKVTELSEAAVKATTKEEQATAIAALRADLTAAKDTLTSGQAAAVEGLEKKLGELEFQIQTRTRVAILQAERPSSVFRIIDEQSGLIFEELAIKEGELTSFQLHFSEGASTQVLKADSKEFQAYLKGISAVAGDTQRAVALPYTFGALTKSEGTSSAIAVFGTKADAEALKAALQTQSKGIELKVIEGLTDDGTAFFKIQRADSP